jgi:hypothetical protein
VILTSPPLDDPFDGRTQETFDSESEHGEDVIINATASETSLITKKDGTKNNEQPMKTLENSAQRVSSPSPVCITSSTPEPLAARQSPTQASNAPLQVYDNLESTDNVFDTNIANQVKLHREERERDILSFRRIYFLPPNSMTLSEAPIEGDLDHSKALPAVSNDVQIVELERAEHSGYDSRFYVTTCDDYPDTYFSAD